MKPSSENLVPKPHGPEVSNLVTYIPPGSNWSTDSRGTFTRETHNPVREAGPAATKHLGDESGTAHKPALCGARFGATEPGITWPLRRPSAVPFPVFHPGCALSGPLADHLQKGPRKWGRSGRLNVLHQGFLTLPRGHPLPRPGLGGRRHCAWRGSTDFIRSAEAPEVLSEGEPSFRGHRDDPRDTPTRVCGEGGSGTGDRATAAGRGQESRTALAPPGSAPDPLPASSGCSLSPDSSP